VAIDKALVMARSGADLSKIARMPEPILPRVQELLAAESVTVESDQHDTDNEQDAETTSLPPKRGRRAKDRGEEPPVTAVSQS
jgi:hypothetical protein